MEAGPLRPKSADDDGEEAPMLVRRVPGPLADDFDEGIRIVDVQKLIKEANAPRDLEAELDVGEESEKLNHTLEKVIKARDEQKALSSVRSRLGLPDEGGEVLKELEETKERLEEDKQHIEVAEKYENVFSEFGDIDGAKEAARTGKNKEGKHFRDKYGKKIDTEVAKGLAQSFINGGGKITWQNLKQLGQVVDQILKDIKSAITGVFGGGEEITVQE